MKIGRAVGRAVVTIVSVFAMLGLTANAASASSTMCKVGYLITSCKTGTVPASAYHTIYYRMCAASKHYADWQVKDATNGVIVAQGRVPDGFCYSNNIYGVYAKYWGWVFNTRAGASAYLDNG
jgi:hypothetical protein